MQVPFTFVPRYMFYILSELLKNAVRATVEQHSFTGCSEMVPITLVVRARALSRESFQNTDCIGNLAKVCTGRGVTSVRISDTGGQQNTSMQSIAGAAHSCPIGLSMRLLCSGQTRNLVYQVIQVRSKDRVVAV